MRLFGLKSTFYVWTNCNPIHIPCIKSGTARGLYFSCRGRRTQMLPSALKKHKRFRYSHSHSNSQVFISHSLRFRLICGATVCITAGIYGMCVYCKEPENKMDMSVPHESNTESTKLAEADPDSSPSLAEAIERSKDLVQRIKDETGSPGLVVAVSVDGQLVWSDGLGYADVENRVKMTPRSVLRIASISKPITMAAVAKQWEKGSLDLDKPVQTYVPSFPQKTFQNTKVTLTTRQLVSQLGGIRHYSKKYMQEKGKDSATNSTKSENDNVSEKTKKNIKNTESQNMDNKSNNQESSEKEMELEEYYIMKKYKTVTESLSLFQDDPLVHSPGSKFLYTTHGWTLISAILEGVTKEPFEKHIINVVRELGMDQTFLDENSPLIYHRARHYIKDKKGRLCNAPYVDLSYKWAGGGLLSTVTDLVKFGNAMLFSYQYADPPTSSSNKNVELHIKPGFLKSETVKALWTPVTPSSENKTEDVFYGMGWFVVEEKEKHGQCRFQRFYASHTGGAIGGSSVLLILPPKSEEYPSVIPYVVSRNKPKGVVVAIVVNMISVNLSSTALEIAKAFQNVKS